MLKSVRRVITAENSDGRSHILDDSLTPHVLETMPHRGLIDLWSMDAAGPDMSVSDGARAPVVISPPKGGNVFRFFQLPPAGDAADDAKASAEMFAKMGAPEAHVDGARDPNMHRTPTLDYIVVLSGRVKLILDEDETIVGPFDVVIQRQTNHAWKNISSEPALLMGVLVDNSARAE